VNPSSDELYSNVRNAGGDAWLYRPAPRRPASARLFCFPYAGVGASVFRQWPAGLPVEFEVCAVQLPGRANRLHEPAVASIQALVDVLVHVMTPHLDLPFAFFGHSMGAVLAFEVARGLASRGVPPSHLIVSGRRPPHIPDLAPPLHGLPDPEFVAEINRRYGGIHPEIFKNRDILALLLPCLRADIAALETHRPTPGSPLACPISAFGGADDPLTPRVHLDAWRGETTGTLEVCVFPGGHFYIEPQRDRVLAELSATLAPMLGVARDRQSTSSSIP
jgi:medium-chain acyl-[acyl-carrier-protein] hydrolase